MKAILLSLVLFVGFAATSQVTKGDIEQMMSDVGTTPDKINSLYVGNTMTYYKDGKSKQGYALYEKSNGNSVSLTDSGIRVNWTKDGKMQSVVYVPYASILTISVGTDFIDLFILR